MPSIHSPLLNRNAQWKALEAWSEPRFHSFVSRYAFNADRVVPEESFVCYLIGLVAPACASGRASRDNRTSSQASYGLQDTEENNTDGVKRGARCCP
jgi:hypothetical protein